MRKKYYESIYKKLYKNNENIEIIKYEEIKSFLQEIKNEKVKTNVSYRKSKEIAELYALSTGFISFALRESSGSIEEKYKNENTIYSSFLTNISNTIFGIVDLIDNGLEYQAKILIRNLMELLFSFLVVIIDKDKRKEYFDTAKLGNSYEIWQKNFKMSKLNEALSVYEKQKFDEDMQEELCSKRRELYKYYSSFVHNDFMSIFLGAYSIDNKDENNSYYHYNLWGCFNFEANQIYETLNNLILIYLMYFRDLITKPQYFDKSNYITKENYYWWNSGFIVLLMLEKELM